MKKIDAKNEADYLCGYVESECVCRLSCSRCSEIFEEYDQDEWGFAESAAKKGWRVTQRERVVCPTCDKKRK